MNSIRPLFLSTYPPQKCGLATFTKDCADAVDLAAGDNVSSVAAIQKTDAFENDDGRVIHLIDHARPDAYRMAAKIANEGPCDIVSLQHEFGLYTGDWGSDILRFVRVCQKPIVTTFHTLMTQPADYSRHLIKTLASHSQGLVVMTKIAAELLRTVYGVSGARVTVIPHGVPDVPFERNEAQKKRLGLEGRRLICTFGLINRGKGLEHMIQAMPTVIAKCPEVVFLIVGATHPLVKQEEGEVYRTSLQEMAEQLGVGDHVKFVDRFLSLPELLDHLRSCEIYISPYLGKDQIASGTLAYAMAAGLAVVSTPYLYASEVLADGRGQLVPFENSNAMADATLRFLTDDSFFQQSRLAAYRFTRPMTWPHVGRQYLELFLRIVKERELTTKKRVPRDIGMRVPTFDRHTPISHGGAK